MRACLLGRWKHPAKLAGKHVRTHLQKYLQELVSDRTQERRLKLTDQLNESLEPKVKPPFPAPPAARVVLKFGSGSVSDLNLNLNLNLVQGPARKPTQYQVPKLLPLHGVELRLPRLTH